MPQNFRQRLHQDFSTSSRLAPARIVLTLLLATAAAALCVRWHTPLPWMIGPLLVTAGLSMLGTPTQSWTPLRNAGQWAIGATLGLYFTPQMMVILAELWWAIVLNIVWAMLAGVALGRWLYWLHQGTSLPWLASFHIPGLTQTTTYFAGPIGAASEMTLMGERHGAQTDLVASSHSLRVLLVTLIIPFGFQWAGLHGLDGAAPATRLVQWPGLALLGLLTGLGCWILVRLGRTNPWFIGALAVSLALTASGLSLSGMPQWITNAAQLVIGISLGVRFTRGFVHMAPRWLASVAFSTLALIALCALFSWLIAAAAGVHPATLMLATAPGGIAEMAITAKVLQLGVPLVTAFHVTRVAAVLLLAEPVFRWFFRPAESASKPALR